MFDIEVWLTLITSQLRYDRDETFPLDICKVRQR